MAASKALADAAAAIIERCAPRIVCGVPLGLGKPNQLLNALYEAVSDRPDVELEIFTALSLDIPTASSDLERRFLQPFVERHFGGHYPRLKYVEAQRRGTLPPNISVSEFYLQSGAWLNNAVAQQQYISTNYTFVARDMADRGVNLLVQLVASNPDQVDGKRLSLSCNPDVTLDLDTEMKRRDQPLMKVAQVNTELPYMGGDAGVADDFFDLVIEEDALTHTLFGVPRQQVGLTEYAIGLHASTLLADGGTLQIGIGALGDALTWALSLRHQHNPLYRQVIIDAQSEAASGGLIDRVGGRGVFERGLYAASEMFTEGFIHLYRAGVLGRRVYDDIPLQRLLNEGVVQEQVTIDSLKALVAYRELPAELEPQHVRWLQHFGFFRPGVEVVDRQLRLPNGQTISNDLEDESCLHAIAKDALGERLQHGVLLHAAFFLGSSAFYQALRDLGEQERAAFQMTAVSNINQLYGGREILDRLQRNDARFINTAMMMTLTGAAVSDQLEDGRVVSGVGGQYNFVAMAHALADGRSILMLRSTRKDGAGRVQSNIRYNYGHTTIPRHLRDIVVTEYGIADLRGQSDAECIKRMLAITDSRFQTELMAQAVAAGKLPADHVIESRYQHNTPEKLSERMAALRQSGHMVDYPFGSDFDATELQLIDALKWLKGHISTIAGRWQLLKAVLRAPAAHQQALQRMSLASPRTFKERVLARLLATALDHSEKT